ncbi:MAG: hypothetical protein MJA31_15365, partial [Clostridia bacterium]|nr:hypothetical protein [Clostridia bacterium]
EATKFAREEEKKLGTEAEQLMVEEYGVEIVTIDKEPIKERTAPIFAKFGEEAGLIDIINRITQ